MGLKAALVFVLGFSFALVSSAEAQETTVGQAKAVRQNFDNCFYSSAMSQIKRDAAQDINMVSEAAFQACATEEQAMLGFMILSHIPQNNSLATITGIKLQLKNKMREIAADPAKYMK